MQNSTMARSVSYQQNISQLKQLLEKLEKLSPDDAQVHVLQLESVVQSLVKTIQSSDNQVPLGEYFNVELEGKFTDIKLSEGLDVVSYSKSNSKHTWKIKTTQKGSQIFSADGHKVSIWVI